MDLASNVITAVVTLGAVALGGWLTVRSQDRHWQRDHARQWRDVRLNAYGAFLTAFRQYIAFALEPSANITAVPHPRKAGELMPFFDKQGRAYRESLESTKTTARLVSDNADTVNAMNDLILQARRIAAVRATHTATEIPSELFDRLWTYERAFVATARADRGPPANLARQDEGKAVVACRRPGARAALARDRALSGKIYRGVVTVDLLRRRRATRSTTAMSRGYPTALLANEAGTPGLSGLARLWGGVGQAALSRSVLSSSSVISSATSAAAVVATL